MQREKGPAAGTAAGVGAGAEVLGMKTRTTGVMAGAAGPERQMAGEQLAALTTPVLLTALLKRQVTWAGALE